MTLSRLTLYAERDRIRACEMITQAPLGHRITVLEPKHSDKQRGKLNGMCGDIAKQADHHGVKLSKDDWRHLISNMVFKGRIVPNLDGDGFVNLTPSTAEMSSAQFNAMIEAAYFIGSERGVVWTKDDDWDDGASSSRHGQPRRINDTPPPSLPVKPVTEGVGA